MPGAGRRAAAAHLRDRRASPLAGGGGGGTLQRGGSAQPPPGVAGALLQPARQRLSGDPRPPPLHRLQPARPPEGPAVHPAAARQLPQPADLSQEGGAGGGPAELFRSSAGGWSPAARLEREPGHARRRLRGDGGCPFALSPAARQHLARPAGAGAVGAGSRRAGGGGTRQCHRAARRGPSAATSG